MRHRKNMIHSFLAGYRILTKKCKLVPNNGGFAVVCKSNVSSHPTKQKSYEKKAEHQKNKKPSISVECTDLETNSSDEINGFILEKIMILNCPLNMFLKGMRLERNDTKAVMKYTCCTWIPLVS
nr:uncharacterized protein LOC100199435 isoform X2 [Hydra vulgaris]